MPVTSPAPRTLRVAIGNDRGAAAPADGRTVAARRRLAWSWLGLGALALLAPLGLVGLDLARSLGALVLAAALGLVLLPAAPLRLRAILATAPLAAAATLLLHPLEGLISPPTVLAATFLALAGTKGALAWVLGPRGADVTLPALVSLALATAILAGWVCGHFWLLAAFVAAELVVDGRLALALSRVGPPRA